jgi:biotin transporter BioY
LTQRNLLLLTKVTLRAIALLMHKQQPPAPPVPRTSQVLQLLANGATFGSKEKFMCILNPFMEVRFYHRFHLFMPLVPL